jgi:hypothetical protein
VDDKISCLLSLDYQPGDLVRLIDDHELEIGVGLVKLVKRDLSDIVDLIQLVNALHNRIEEDIFPSKPQLFVLWSGGKKVMNSEPKAIWMYSTDVALYRRAVRSN